MPRISRYNRESKRLEWVDASDAEYDAWRAARAAKRTATPAAAPAKGGKRSRRAPRPTAGASSAAETLEDVTDDAVRQAAKSAGPPKPTAGPLSPVLGLLSRFGAVALIRVSATLTAGRHPMTPPEAVSITSPALRIADRELGKRVKWTPKGGPNTRDMEQIGTAVATYILRSMFGGQATPQPGPMPNPAQTPAPGADMPAEDAIPMPPASSAATDAADDEGDLFAGSEPVGKAASAASTPAARQRTAGPPGAVSVPDAVWNQISPPERGLAEVMG